MSNRIKEFSIKALHKLMYFLIFALLFLVAYLATAQVIRIIKPPQTFQILLSQNGYNIFQDIFSDIEDLRKAIQSFPDGSQGSGTIMKKVDALEDSMTKISDTIMINPDQAITAKLLQNDQGALKDRVIKLESGVVAINARIDNFYTIIITIIVALLGFKYILVPIFQSRNKE
ncbi:MAG: hypothetical protein WCS85_03985 [Candidatus Peribacteraceae bacterium]